MKPNRVPTSVRIIAFVSLCMSGMDRAWAMTIEKRLSRISDSMQQCVKAASRPGYPYYDRPEAAETCQGAKSLLRSLQREANRNRNLGCSRRIANLYFNIWMIQFIGGERMQSETEKAIAQLKRSCYSMNDS